MTPERIAEMLQRAEAMPPRNKSRLHMQSVPHEVIPAIDKLREQGHTYVAIGECLGVYWRTAAKAAKRQGAYKGVPK